MALPSPPMSLNKTDVDIAWYRLLTFMLSSNAINATWENILLVGTDGSDATAQRNSLTKKYRTIQAAMDSAQEGDVVWVGPGVYDENITWPDTNNITLKGFGRYSTVIMGEVTPTLDLSPTVSVQIATIQDLAISSSDVSPAMNVDGVANPACFNPLTIKNVFFVDANSITISNINRVEIEDVVIQGMDLTLTEVSGGEVVSSKMENISYENTELHSPNTGLGNYFVIDSSVVEGILLNSLARMVLSKDTQCTSVTTNIEDHIVGGDTFYGAIWCFGKVAGNIDISHELTIGPQEIGRFDYAEIAGTVTGAGLGVDPEFATVNFRHASFYNTAPGSIAANARVIFDIRGALFNEASLVSSTDGSIDRTHWQVTDTNPTLTSEPVAIDPPFPAGVTNYTVLTECTGPTAYPVAISNKIASSFNRTKAANETVNFTIYRPYD